MAGFRNILVYLDSRPESPAGLELALALAQSDGGRVRVVDVLRPLPLLQTPGALREGEIDVAGPELAILVLRERELALDEVIRPLAALGVRVERHVAWGSPFLELVRQVIADRHDLVIKTAEGRAPLRPSLFGSTAMHLLRKAPCPVWIAKMGSPVLPRCIVAAVDPLAEDPLSEKIVKTALDLAQRTGSRLHVVGAWSTPGSSILRTTLGRDGLSRYGALLQRQAKASLEQAVARLGARLGTVEIHVLEGEPHEVVPAFVSTCGADLLVLGTVARGGIPGLFIGTEAEQIMRAIECSVLALKPDGFVSPVTLATPDSTSKGDRR